MKFSTGVVFFLVSQAEAFAPQTQRTTQQTALNAVKKEWALGTAFAGLALAAQIAVAAPTEMGKFITNIRIN